MSCINFTSIFIIAKQKEGEGFLSLPAPAQGGAEGVCAALAQASTMGSADAVKTVLTWVGKDGVAGGEGVCGLVCWSALSRFSR